MAKIFYYLQFIFAVHCVLSAPQIESEADNEIPDTETEANAAANNGDYELDYSQPGVAVEDCICVPLYLCEDGQIVDDGTGIIDARNKPQPELALDEKYIPPECGPYHVCCGNPDTSTSQPYVHRCGTRNPGGISGRILTPHATGEAELGEWPWQAVILKKDGDDFIFKCGGTLIDERHVLTVAHCVDKLLNDVVNVIVRLGEWDTQSNSDIFPHEDYDVSEIIIHPEYRTNNLHNDIAILKLSRNVIFKPHIDTICLPRDDDDFTGQDCVITGYGTNAYKNGAYSNILKEVNVPVIGHEECQTMLRNTRVGKYYKLHGGFLCAGGQEGLDACKGDGGGPLVCFRSDNSYTVAGLVSWGIDCGQPNVPGVYVNVKKYINWIVSKTGKQLPEYWSSQ